jgi:hypothetical protein
MQGYNAQAATNERQIVVAAEVTIDSPDFGHLEPMVEAAEAELERAGVTESPEVVVADAGYGTGIRSRRSRRRESRPWSRPTPTPAGRRARSDGAAATSGCESA